MSDSERGLLVNSEADSFPESTRTERETAATANPLERNQSNSSISSMESTISISELSDSINPHRTFVFIFLLAIIVGGLQLSWCTEFSEGTPFLLSLGISKEALALVWIAGPLSGSFGQPIIGIFSDNSTNKSGRRKPFIIGGAIATSLSLFYLSYSVNLVALFFPKGTDIERIKHATIPFAAFGVYLLDFSISAIQAASRAYIVDNVPTHQQQIANAMAAILIGGFNIVGYFLGSINLVKYFWILGADQFKILSAIASITLLITSCVSLFHCKERDPTTDIVIRSERKKNRRRLKQLGIEESNSFLSIVRSLYKQTTHSISRLSPQVTIICYAQFFAWIGYFPMLFYTTTYVGELFKYEFFKARDPSLPPLTGDEVLWLNNEATRKGSLALLLHSISSFAVDLLLPFLVQPFNSESTSEPKVISRSFIGELLENFRIRWIPWLTVRNSWYLSHVLFIISMVTTFFISSSNGAIALFAVLGITWGTALWAPFVLISEEISRIKEIKARIHKERVGLGTDANNTLVTDSTAAAKYENYEHEAGIILGLHNFFVATPQVISSLFSSLIFSLLSDSTNDGSKYDSSLGWVFRFGGAATIGALILSLKVHTNEELSKEEDDLFLSA